MGAGRVTTAATRRRPRWWIALTLTAICGVAAVSAYLTAPRSGGRMDAASTGPEGTHALVALLRDRGVDVVVANTVTDAERGARPGTLLVLAQSQYLADPALMRRLEEAPGDLLLVEPTSRARAALAPGVRSAGAGTLDNAPNCSLREAVRAGSVQFGPTNLFRAVGDRAVTSCYDGALVRYRDGDRTITLVGSSDFMTNGGLLHAGNAALAMNLAGARHRVVWFAPQRFEGTSSSTTSIFDLLPHSVIWAVAQLCLAVALTALWKGRRIGPLVAEELPVVVRASETVEGRGRLYRSRQARDRAAQALRAATLHRLGPRLGLGGATSEPALVAAVEQRNTADPETVWHTLFGPPPATDTDLVHLARALDDIERQVAHS
ncbi:DUF4350 domain-containing protein [Mycobacterium sp.]|uniref:DUF4350 domain-containing protein n=1 Tax=Mycobacterium sp. TaxID=1785 RepID=UPI0031D09A4C